MTKAGLDYNEIRKLRGELASLTDKATAPEIVRAYLSASAQVAARARSDDEKEFSKDATSFLASWVTDWLEAGGDMSKAEFMIKPLLEYARTDPVAYENAKPAIAAMMRNNAPEIAREFVADDYAGAIKATPKTRRTTPNDYFRQAQAVVAVHALIEAGLSGRASRRIVAEVSTALGIEWPSARLILGQVTDEQIRNAYRSPKFARLLWDH